MAMKILLVAATPQEIAPLLSSLTRLSENSSFLSVYSHKNIEIHVLTTGVGMVATAYHTAKALRNPYDFAINAGLAGSFNRNLQIGDVVQVYEDEFSELGAEDDNTFIPFEKMNLPGESKITNNNTLKNPFLEQLPGVTGITVNTVHGNDKNIAAVWERHHPFVETMEGAAFLLVCKHEQVPCIQLRSISNYVEKRNREKWNIGLAVKNLNDTLLNFLNTLPA
jgi:futalosine hydrolase